MELSRRLTAVAHAVLAGRRLADVGTDHAYLPITLVRRGVCPHAFAMDVNRGPLLRAQEHIEAEGLTDYIETRLGSGLSPLAPGEADAVVIAGMGGDLICRILHDAPEHLRAGVELVLQPQSEWFKVRRFLHGAGYAIRKEWFLCEDGKYYVVIQAFPGTEVYEHKWEYLYGKCLIEERDPVLLSYLRRELSKKEAIRERLLAGLSGEAAVSLEKCDADVRARVEGRKNRCRELAAEIDALKEVMARMR